MSEPVAHTPATKDAAYVEGLREELAGAKARAGWDNSEADQKLFDAYLVDVTAELARATRKNPPSVNK